MKTKRLFIFVVVLFLSLFLFACNMAGGTEGGDDAESIVLNAINNVAIRYAEGDSANSITQNIVLASSDVVNFAWASDNDAISNLGVVTRGEEDINVKLTLRATYGDITLEKSFNVVVKGTKVEDPNENPGENPGEDPNENPGEDPNENPGEDPNENPGEDPNENPGEDPITPPVDPSEGDYTDISVLLANGASETEYTIRGKIDSISNATYGNMTISDSTGSIFLYGVVDATGAKYGDFTSYKPVVGDTIVVKGAVTLYNEETLEVVNALLISYEKGEGGNIDPITPPVNPNTGEYTNISVLIANGAGETEYTIRGVIDNIANTTYGNMTIADSTGSMFLYGIVDATGAKYGDFTSYKPVVGDIIVVKGVVVAYNDTLEIKNALLVSYEKGEGGNVDPITPPVSDDPIEGTIADVLAAATDTVYNVKGVTVVCLYARGYLVTDGTNYILVYKNTESFDVVVGDEVDIQGTITAYHNRNQFGTDTVATNKENGTVPAQTATLLDATEMAAFIANPVMGKLVKIEGACVIDGSYVNIKIDGTDKIVSVQYPETSKGFASLNGKLVSFEAYTLDLSSDSSRVNVMVLGNVTANGDALVDPVTPVTPITGGTVELPATASFLTDATGSTNLPEGWVWVVQNSKGAYATKYQSFRTNGEKIQSPSFEAEDGVKFSLKVYLNNYQTSATVSSQIKAVAYNAEGTQVAEVTSENINAWATGTFKTGDTSYSKTLEFDLVGEGITYVTFEFVKNGGGNVGIMEAKIEGAN